MYWEPFVPWLWEAEQTQLLAESVGISGVCFPVTQISRIVAMKSVQWLFLVPGYLGGVRSVTAGLALLCLKDSPLPQPGKLWCVFCVPEFQSPGSGAPQRVVGVVSELLPRLFLTPCSGRLLTSSQKQLLFSYTHTSSLSLESCEVPWMEFI